VALLSTYAKSSYYSTLAEAVKRHWTKFAAKKFFADDAFAVDNRIEFLLHKSEIIGIGDARAALAPSP